MKRLLIALLACVCAASAHAQARADTARNSTGWIVITSPVPGQRFCADDVVTVQWKASGNLDAFCSNMINQHGTWGRAGSEIPVRNDSMRFYWQPLRISNRERDEPIEIHVTGYQTGIGSVDAYVKVVFEKIK